MRRSLCKGKTYKGQACGQAPLLEVQTAPSSWIVQYIRIGVSDAHTRIYSTSVTYNWTVVFVLRR